MKQIYERGDNIPALVILNERFASGDLCDISDSMVDTPTNQSRNAGVQEVVSEVQISYRSMLSHCEGGFPRSMQLLLALTRRRVNSLFCTTAVAEFREFVFGDNDLMTLTENGRDRIYLSAALRYPTQLLTWLLYDPPQIDWIDEEEPWTVIVQELVETIRRDQATIDFLLAYRPFSGNDQNAFIRDLF